MSLPYDRPYSRTGSQTAIRGPEQGFTLLELLVVLVIISIIISFAVLSVGDGGERRRITIEGERLVALIEQGGMRRLFRVLSWVSTSRQTAINLKR